MTAGTIWKLPGIASAALLIFMLTPGLSEAKESYQPLFDALYDGRGFQPGDCTVCHIQGEKLNAYGKDFSAMYKHEKKSGKGSKDTLRTNAMKSIEGLDSDRDGYTNREEIQAGTNPGDAKAKPASRQADQGTPLRLVPIDAETETGAMKQQEMIPKK